MKHIVALSATIDLNDVKAFVQVVEAGSFTQAARQLGMPKSAVSRKVARLEESLGARLLQRTTRRLHLTDAGTQYHQHAVQALATLYEAASTVGELQSEPRGTVRMTTPGMHEFLAGLLREFSKLYPKVFVEVVVTGRTVDLVAEGFDLAVRAGILRDSSMRARRLGSSQLVLLASPAYLERRGKPKRPDDLAEHDCILFRPENGLNRWSLSGPDGERTVTVRGPMGADDYELIGSLAKLGQGIALMPLQSCLEDLRSKQLVRVLPTWRGPHGSVYLVHPASRHVPQRVVLLRDHLYDGLRGVFVEPAD